MTRCPDEEHPCQLKLPQRPHSWVSCMGFDDLYLQWTQVLLASIVMVKNGENSLEISTQSNSAQTPAQQWPNCKRASSSLRLHPWDDSTAFGLSILSQEKLRALKRNELSWPTPKIGPGLPFLEHWPKRAYNSESLSLWDVYVFPMTLQCLSQNLQNFLKDPHAIAWKYNHQEGQDMSPQSQWKDNLNLPTSRHNWPSRKYTHQLL